MASVGLAGFHSLNDELGIYFVGLNDMWSLNCNFHECHEYRGIVSIMFLTETLLYASEIFFLLVVLLCLKQSLDCCICAPGRRTVFFCVSSDLIHCNTCFHWKCLAHFTHNFCVFLSQPVWTIQIPDPFADLYLCSALHLQLSSRLYDIFMLQAL